MADSFPITAPTPRTNDGLPQSADSGVNLRMTPSRGAAAEGGTLKNPGHGPSPDSMGSVGPGKPKGI